MPVDRVKEIDPISSAVTEPLRDSPWDKIGIQIHIPQPLVEDLSKGLGAGGSQLQKE